VLENRNVSARGNDHPQRFLPALALEILTEPPAKQPGGNPDDIVIGGVVVDGLAEYLPANLGLVNVLFAAEQGLLADVEKERAQSQRPPERVGFRNAEY
jgi:hypothetical protein